MSENTIKTQRLLLRPYKESDRESYIDLVTDREVMEHVEPEGVDDSKAHEWWNRLVNKLYPSGLRWCAVSKDDSRYIGHAMLNYSRPNNECELGYILPRLEWGKGFATEIADALAIYSRESMGLPRIFATVDEGFEPSINVIKKIGMNFHGYDYDETGRFLVYVLDHAAGRKADFDARK